MNRITTFILTCRRLFEIFRVVITCCLKKEVAGPKRLRDIFEELGGAFIKFGQILALRQDLIPYEYTLELLNLLDETEETPLEEIEKVFAEEKGMPIKSFFKEFNTKPIASGSIGQVYEARLKDGTRVAVKIQKPNVKEVFERDFALISFFASLVDFFRIFSSIKFQEVAMEFISWTRNELDFTLEAKNMEIVYRHRLKHPEIVIPKPFVYLSTQRVLIQEFIGAGVSAKDIILKKVDKNLLSELIISPAVMSSLLISESMRQYFIDGFFHADPHPANLVFLPGNKLAYFDFGIVGKAGDHRLLFLKILYSVASEDVDAMAGYFLEYGEKILSEELEAYLVRDLEKRKAAEKIFEKIKEIIRKNLKEDISGIMTGWYRSLENPSSSLKEKSVSVPFFEVLKIAEGYGITLPKDMILFLRALAILDMTALQVDNDFNIIKSLKMFFQKYPLEELERIIQTEEHDAEVGEKIDSLTDVSWEFFREFAMLEKERMLAAREKIYELIIYYAEHYDEIRSMLKNLIRN